MLREVSRSVSRQEAANLPLRVGQRVRTNWSFGEPPRGGVIAEIRRTHSGGISYVLADGGWFSANELEIRT